MKSLNYYLKSSFQRTTIPLGITCILTGSSTVNALPTNNLSQLLQLISQNGSQPPEVIIDTNPGSIPPPPPTSNPTSTTTTTSSTGNRFSCEIVNGEYTVMYRPESQPNGSYPWAIPSQLGGGWTPERRCNEITRRFESYRQDGLLELTTGVENGYNTICVTTQVNPTDCRIVLTVPPGQDPQLTRDLIFENLLIADDGQQTQGVYTYSDGRGGRQTLGEIGTILGEIGIDGAEKIGNAGVKSPDKIDLRPFLDPADGGTGENLKRGRANAPQPTNNKSPQRKPAIFQ